MMKKVRSQKFSNGQDQKNIKMKYDKKSMLQREVEEILSTAIVFSPCVLNSRHLYVNTGGLTSICNFHFLYSKLKTVGIGIVCL